MIASACYFDPFCDGFYEQAEYAEDGLFVDTNKDDEERPEGITHRLLRRAKHFTAALGSHNSIWLVSVVITTVCVLLSYIQMPKHAVVPINTAGSLLNEARLAENTRLVIGGALHSTFALETRLENGTLVAKQTVDAWRSLNPHRSAVRLIDNKGKVAAGEWKGTDGKVVEYRAHHSARTLTDDVEAAQAWQIIGDGIDADLLSDEGDRLTATNISDSYDIHLEQSSKAASAGLVRANWLINPASGKLLSGDLVIRQKSGVRKYSFQMLTSDFVPAADVSDGVFAEDPNLSESRPTILRAPGTLSSAQVMLDALTMIDHLAPRYGDLLDLQRKADGIVEITGVLRTKSDLEALERSARPLLATGRLQLSLHSHDDRDDAATPLTKISVSEEEVPIDTAKFPLEEELREGLRRTGLTGAALDAAVLSVAHNSILHGAKAKRSAYRLNQIANAYLTQSEIRSLSLNDRIRWIELLGEQSSEVNDELLDLQFALSPILNSKTLDHTSLPSLATSGQLAEAATQLNAQCSQLSGLLTSQFAVSANDVPNQPSGSALVNILTNTLRLNGQINSTLALVLTDADPNAQ